MSVALRVMSFNIRYPAPADGPNAWANRAAMVASMIRFHRADAAGLQEATRAQLGDLEALLPDYAWVGAGRDDGWAKGEFAPIFYLRDRLTVARSGTFWLSETPDVAGSLGWGATLPRIATWAVLREPAAGRHWAHFNAHFDHESDPARTESARLMLARMARDAADLPIVLTGDFNANERSAAYAVLTHALADARLRSERPHHGPATSWNGFAGPVPDMKIDHIFVNDRVRVVAHGILSDMWDGRYPSDHFPVIADVIPAGTTAWPSDPIHPKHSNP